LGIDGVVEGAVCLRAVDTYAELFRLYAGMNTAMDRLCASYDDELQLLADFLHRTTNAGRTRHRPAGQRVSQYEIAARVATA
jgi:hypothetical protein